MRRRRTGSASSYVRFTCGGWTSSSPSFKPDNVNTGRGYVFSPLGGFVTSFVAVNDGGCENPRPMACCDGYPPQ